MLYFFKCEGFVFAFYPGGFLFLFSLKEKKNAFEELVYIFSCIQTKLSFSYQAETSNSCDRNFEKFLDH